MVRKIYTAGYAGHLPADLLRLVLNLDAWLFDIRLVPRSRLQGWNRGSLVRVFGDRYVHVGALGNLNYKSNAPIVLNDPVAGLAVVGEMTKPVVLMCACREYARCHRRTVVELLLAQGGWEHEELNWNAGAANDVGQLVLPIIEDPAG